MPHCIGNNQKKIDLQFWLEIRTVGTKSGGHRVSYSRLVVFWCLIVWLYKRLVKTTNYPEANLAIALAALLPLERSTQGRRT